MSRAPSLKKRRKTLKKKAEELSTLCGIDVAYLCFDPNGRVDTWPEDPNTVKDIVLKYRDVKSKEKPSAAASSASSGGSEIHEEIGAPKSSRKPKLDGLSGEELLGVHRSVEEKLEKVRSRIEILEDNGESKKKRRRRDSDLKTLNLIGLPPVSSETECTQMGNRCSSSSGADSSTSLGSSMITVRSDSPISDPKSEWGKFLSL